MIRGIHHVAISTPDLERLVAFYRDVMQATVHYADPDFAALVLGNYLLGGSSAGRLPQRVRESSSHMTCLSLRTIVTLTGPNS